ncbi:hypothetical protein ASPWEDRAFT_35915 [Aspergillus wentii DTO 134E9]|uniref:Major facilitator superfamily (MFS) profile domain-containing protein n=1 Tax=Aspergillus wentii DTO 134E9 TaxID=1073089 RepID=A0A1L9RTN5_ASPWE|nr:uncharacterized protein ASPWEDRAFT_35915 [Aspergillus wentii DTO 134E9]KAI9933932.1 hypothetical protein MW887_005004 [Aspergillus wentii]OJJ38290.1 hypothetical protein ASPWEDRAFT_35915 [Aspergillus wentii DTO 134E9]
MAATTSENHLLRPLPPTENPSPTTPGTPADNQLEYFDPSNVATQEDIPPDGGYGWVCTICVFLINAHTWGVNSAWGVFLDHYLSESTFPGATELQYALIGGLSISQSLLVSPLVAISTRKLGTRITLLIGAFVVCASLLGASFASQIWHLFLSQGLCFGYGMGFLYVPATAILPQWFSKRRSLVLGIGSAGAGIGGLAYNLGSGAAIESLGLQWTYRLLALCTLVMNFICSILLKDRNTVVKPKDKAFDYREYGRVQVLLVVSWGFLTELGFIVLLYSLPNYATSIGLTARQGSVVSALLNLGLTIGRPLIGYYSDIVGRINMATLMTTVCGVLCLAVWVPAKSYPVLLIFALLSGCVTGTFWTCAAPVLAEVVGMQRLPSAWGMICFSLVLPTTFAEPIALQMASTSGYLASQIFVGCMFLGGAASTWALRSWKIHEIEEKARIEREEPARKDFWLTPRRLFVSQRV